MQWIRPRINALLDPLSRSAFLLSLPERARLLDVGCGNHGPTRAKRVRPDIFYVGIDIGACNMSPRDDAAADRLLIAEPSRFHEGIAEAGNDFDAILSSHNIEHCDRPMEVLRALAGALKPGGRLYISFPAPESVNFPSRAGTLNFYDDDTHKHVISLDAIEPRLAALGIERRRAVRRNGGRWQVPRLLGLAAEPLSRFARRVLPFTWYYYGFETVWIGERVERH
jgi:SAM-dependent methyltransferase